MLRACIFSRRRSDAEQRFTLEPAAGPRRTTKVAGFVLSAGVPGLSSGISTGEAHLARRRVVNESFGAPILSRSKSRSGCTRPEASAAEVACQNDEAGAARLGSRAVAEARPSAHIVSLGALAVSPPAEGAPHAAFSSIIAPDRDARRLWRGMGGIDSSRSIGGNRPSHVYRASLTTGRKWRRTTAHQIRQDQPISALRVFRSFN